MQVKIKSWGVFWQRLRRRSPLVSISGAIAREIAGRGGRSTPLSPLPLARSRSPNNDPIGCAISRENSTNDDSILKPWDPTWRSPISSFPNAKNDGRSSRKKIIYFLESDRPRKEYALIWIFQP
ncbi:hypothetical protein [Oxynema aestuarii]|uniref:Uncharacterized protein n=1 Tax=Oxynema aestuarii AP17 TaxID=2064643 RepID=A0A6H1U309_9CYAN|nr:hypothetical protein [Oxynema aestuarii]QIZ73224.1 hypothetical protein HCG48_23660 [Oxynema aestuarii AP17]